MRVYGEGGRQQGGGRRGVRLEGELQIPGQPWDRAGHPGDEELVHEGHGCMPRNLAVREQLEATTGGGRGTATGRGG